MLKRKTRMEEKHLPALQAEQSISPHSPAQEAVHHAVILGDLSRCTKRMLIEYHGEVCQSLGLNPLTKPFDYLMLGKEGERKLVLYANKNCTDQLRALHGISVTIAEEREQGGLYFVKARAEFPNGKSDEDYGVVPIPEWMRTEKNGGALANTYMRCVTKAKRRVTLSICGLGGIMDETELDTVPADEKQLVDLARMEDDDVLEVREVRADRDEPVEKKPKKRAPTKEEAATFNPPEPPPPPHGNGKAPRKITSIAPELLPPNLPEEELAWWSFPVSRGNYAGRPMGELPIEYLKNYLSNHRRNLTDEEAEACAEVLVGKQRAEFNARLDSGEDGENEERSVVQIDAPSKREKLEVDRIPEDNRKAVSQVKQAFPGSVVERGDTVPRGTRSLSELGMQKILGGPHRGLEFRQLDLNLIEQHLYGNLEKERARGITILPPDYRQALEEYIELFKADWERRKQDADADEIPEFV
jgi:hypothetical protein